MSRLNKEKTYAILWLNSQGSSISDIANELSIGEPQINKVLEKQANSTNTPNIKTAKSPASKSHDMMIRHTGAKNINNVAIMTKEASEYNDSIKPSMQQNNKNSNHIFRPRDNG